MADRSAIEWTDASWNPIRARNTATGKIGWHCTHVSEGCRNCYAEGFNRRLGTGLDYKPAVLASGQVELFLDEAMLTQPLRWKKPRKIFVGSMTDLFADFVTDAMLDRIVVIMARAPRHTFQIVTKRPERMRDYWTRLPQRIREMQADSMLDDVILPLPNVWLMVSAEDQPTLDARIPILLDTPAAVRGVSAEPLLAAIDFKRWAPQGRRAYRLGGEPFYAPHFYMTRCEHCGWVGSSGLCSASDDDIHCAACFRSICGDGFPTLDLVIVGGESGPNARPMHPDWARQIRDQCEAAGVAFFFKQWGEWTPGENAGPFRSRNPGAWFDDAGKPLIEPLTRQEAEDCTADSEPDVWRVGKKAAGRLLDGREHNDLPGQAA